MNRNFTGQTQDTTAGLYDFLFRQQSSAQGRWLVPDPAGLAAVDITNPQTWNRYAYVGNNPPSRVDPLGLDSDQLICGNGGCVELTSIDVVASPLGVGVFGGMGRSLNKHPIGNEDNRCRFCSGGFNLKNPFPQTAPKPKLPAASNNQQQPDVAPGIDIWHCPGCQPIWQNASQVTDPRNIALWYGASLLAGGGTVVVLDLAQGPADSLLFGTQFQGNAALWNSADSFRIGYSQVGEDQFVFRIGGDFLENFVDNPHINLWPPSWWFGPPGP